MISFTYIDIDYRIIFWSPLFVTFWSIYLQSHAQSTTTKNQKSQMFTKNTINKRQHKQLSFRFRWLILYIEFSKIKKTVPKNKQKKQQIQGSTVVIPLKKQSHANDYIKCLFYSKKTKGKSLHAKNINTKNNQKK